MRSASPLFGGGLPPIPRVTRALLATYVGLSILNAVLRLWLRLVDVSSWLDFSAGDVLRGQVWRLVTYPWIDGSPLAILFGCFAFVFFGGNLETQWGTRRYVQRIVLLVAVPATVVTLLGALVPALRPVTFGGVSTLAICFITAFASQLKSARVTLFPLPIQLGGDQLLIFEGAILAISILFSGAILPALLEVVAFGVALAWFRFDVARDLRRSVLRLRKRRLESKVARIRKQRNLRVVRSDDDEGGHYLH
jgi:membrane associated rhomboid family serine protease